MKNFIDSLNKGFHKYCDIEMDYQKAMDILAKIEFCHKQTIIDELRGRRNDADKKMHEYYNAIVALQKICTHIDSNCNSAFKKSGDTHEKCEICGAEKTTIS